MLALNQSLRLTALPMILLALIVLALQGCSSDDAPPPTPTPVPDANPTGYYTNTGFVDVMMADNTTPRPSITDLQGMVNDGKLKMLSDTEGLSYVGTFTVTENDFSGSVTVYEAGVMTQDNVPLNGMITEGAKITGTLGGTGAGNGTFQLDYAPLADNGPVDMPMVIPPSNTWLPVNNSDSFNISIGDDLEPIPNFGSSGSGQGAFDNCTFLARIEPVPGRHLYTVSGAMKDCINGAILMPDGYSGLVSVRGSAPGDRLIVVLSNGAYGITGEYVRQ